MTASLHPGLVLILGSLALPALRGWVRSAYLLFLTGFSLWIVANMPQGALWSLDFMGQSLVLGRIDNLSRVFGLAFSLVTLLGVMFALRVEDDWQNVSALVYAGSALGVTFASDWLSLYLFWELMAVASAFIILAARTDGARAAGLRYILVHVAGGLILLAGIMLHQKAGGSLELGHLSLDSAASWLIFAGVAVNAAVWPLHAWLTDSYPRATPTGAVFLSVLTTKSAVYVMARVFAGTQELILLGTLMALIPLVYAYAEDDIRRVLAFVLVNQVGFMLVGVGIGSPLSLNGTSAHAFAHILYDGLLFMALGAVIHMTGRSSLSSLGGLFKSFPCTSILFLVGAGSISALPGLAGFPTKSMILGAAGEEHLLWVWLALQAASAGVFGVVGVLLPWRIFFGPEKGLKAKQPPANMVLAMLLAAGLCAGVGLFPGRLYRLLPFETAYSPYTLAHLLEQLQVMGFVGLGLSVLFRLRLLPVPKAGLLIDTDWFYIRAAGLLFRFFDRVLNGINGWADRIIAQGLAGALARFFQDSPARLAYLAGTALYLFAGIRGDRLKRRQRRLLSRVRNSALPLGLGAAAGVTGLLILFMAARL